MRTLRNAAVAVVFASILATSFAFGQSPLIYKQVTFNINVPYRLRMTNYELPQGNYILRQVSQNDINLFFLYKDSLTHPPVAVVRTVRVVANSPADYPEKTEILYRTDESDVNNVPIIRGFTIHGEEAFQIINVVPKKGSMLVRVY